MITNFETITRELDRNDLKFLPIIIAGMRAHAIEAAKNGLAKFVTNG
jgi:hypothetical protein